MNIFLLLFENQLIKLKRTFFILKEIKIDQLEFMHFSLMKPKEKNRFHTILIHLILLNKLKIFFFGYFLLGKLFGLMNFDLNHI